MNYLSKLPSIVTRKKKRLGRGLGGGAGAKSGRGTKRHQKAREKIPIFFEGGQNPITKKFPLLRGKGKNKSIRQKPKIVKLGLLNNFKPNSRISSKELIGINLVTEKDVKRGIKIVGGGELKIPLIVSVPTTEKVRISIEKAGGKVDL